jgi:hypothetical protein
MDLNETRSRIARARKALADADLHAIAGAIGNSGPATLPRVGDADWTKCYQALRTARAEIDAVLAPPVPKCYICGEAVTEDDERAEVADNVLPPEAPHGIVHVACYTEQKWRYTLA